MQYKTLDSFNFKSKLVLVRVDINSEIRNGKVISSDRITESKKTIDELKRKNAKVVVIAHQGRPGSKDFTNLEQHAKLLKIKFVDDIVGSKAITAIRNLEDGEAILLDNIRKIKDELNVPKNAKDNVLVKTLVPFFDYYVNDAFSVSHREQTSITVFPKYIKSRIGRTMQRELNNLEKLDIKNCTLVLGGVKTEDIALLLKNKPILSTGVFANICLAAKGYRTGIKHIPKEVKENIAHIVTPIDLAININGKRKEISVDELPTKHEILDIGTETAEIYAGAILASNSVFMKGTAGLAEKKGFEKGTKTLLNAMQKTKAFTAIAGGNTITAAKRFRIKNIDYVSLSGGALVHYLAGKKLPGLEALK